MSTPVTETQVAAFLRVLDAADATTGGGTASAFAGSMAAGLIGMVARLSLGPGAAESAAFYQQIIQAGAELTAALLSGADEDARSFDGVMAAYRLPKSTNEERQVRSVAIQAALTHATRIPLRNAEYCAEVLALVARLQGCANPRTLSDLQSAGYLALAGLQGCLANVDINLPGIKDSAVAEEIRACARRLRPEGRTTRESHAQNPAV